MELSATSVARCREKGLDVDVDDGTSIVGTFDAVALFQVLEHVGDPAATLDRLIAHLNPGGLLMIGVPNPDYVACMDESSILNMPPHHATIWSKQAFEFAARKFGLTLVRRELEPLRYIHYVGHLATLVGAQKRVSEPLSLWGRLLFKIRMEVAMALAPIGYAAARQELVGHTHFVVLRKS